MTCPHCGASLLRVERHRDFSLERLRAVFVCGHSFYVDAPSPARDPVRTEGPYGTVRCNVCAGPFVRRSAHARRCDACCSPVTVKYKYRSLAGVP